MRHAVVVTLLLFFVSCATAPAPDPNAERIDRFIRHAMTQFPEVPSLGVAIVADGRTILTRGYGMRDLEQKLPATEDTVYYIASSTKSYVGLLTSMLAKRGVVDLDAPITRYLPELRFAEGIDPRNVTLRTLLTHTSGIDNDAIVMRTAYTGEHTGSGLVTLLGHSKTREAKFQYDNLGYVAAGLVLERVTGRSWQDLLAEELFAPAGMARTTAYMSRTASWPLATPYDLGRDLRVQPVANLKNDRTMHAAGGLVTTPRDLARWLELNVNGGRLDGRQVIDAAALAEAQRKQVPTTERDWYRFKRHGYAFGWHHSDYEGTLLLHHFGGYEGWRAHVSFLPQQRHGVAIATNTGGTGAPVRDLIAAFAYDVLLGKPNVEQAYDAHLAKMRGDANAQLERVRADIEKRRQRKPSLTRARSAYAGTYSNDAYGSLQIRMDGDALRASIGQLAAPLEPFTEPETARVELVPGQGEVLKFVFEGDDHANAVQWRDEVFRRVE